MVTKQIAGGHDVIRAGKFGLVGILNTVLDFLIFNLLILFGGLAVIPANLISTTAAMIFSFVANKQLVFEKKNGSVARQAILFFVVTAFGLYVLQTATIHLLTGIWLWPISVGLAVAHFVGINGHDQFLIKNGAKAVATLVSLTWNYIMYKKVVFS